MASEERNKHGSQKINQQFNKQLKQTRNLIRGGKNYIVERQLVRKPIIKDINERGSGKLNKAIKNT